MNSCLAWDFPRPSSVAAGALSAARYGGRDRAAGDAAADLVATRAPAEWVALAHAAPLRQWLIGALTAAASASASGSAPAGGALPPLLRQLLIQLCLLAPWNVRGEGGMEVAELGVCGILAVSTSSSRSFLLLTAGINECFLLLVLLFAACCALGAPTPLPLEPVRCSQECCSISGTAGASVGGELHLKQLSLGSWSCLRMWFGYVIRDHGMARWGCGCSWDSCWVPHAAHGRG
jgi:hypothetical protein